MSWYKPADVGFATRRTLVKWGYATRLLLRLVDQVADSEAWIEDVAALFSSRPFTWDFTGGAGGTRIDAALQRLCVLSVLTRADVERMRGKLHGASP